MSYTLHHGDCLDVLKTLPDSSVDSIVTDPPYGLGKEPDALAMLTAWMQGADYMPKGKGGFMGKEWDAFVPQPSIWRECMRVLKPGGHIVAFSGTRTQHLMALGLQIAGFELRDMLAWVYGSGFPKSLDVSKAIDKAAGAEREVLARKAHSPTSGSAKFGQAECSEYVYSAAATDAAQQWDGFGTALKPALEPVTLARKPFPGTVAANVQQHGTGALNIDGCRIETADALTFERKANGETASGWKDVNRRPFEQNKQGRWPANLLHDGSPEVLAGFPAKAGAAAPVRRGHDGASNGIYGDYAQRGDDGATFYGDTGSAARFFYVPKKEQIDLFFCRAKTILAVWNQDLANTADSRSCLSKKLADSALRDAAIWASHGGRQLSDLTIHFTSVTESELKTLVETLITLTLIIEKNALHELLPTRLFPNNSLVKCAAIQTESATTQITISLSRLSGFADAATFSITPLNLVLGEKGLGHERFRYCAKASKADRNEGLGALPDQVKLTQMRAANGTGDKNFDGGFNDSIQKNPHPTVKPTELMRWLCRLITPPGGVVLDPFAGSGSTGKAALLEGFTPILIEREAEYLPIIRARCEAALSALPLFAAQ